MTLTILNLENTQMGAYVPLCLEGDTKTWLKAV